MILQVEAQGSYVRGTLLQLAGMRTHFLDVKPRVRIIGVAGRVLQLSAQSAVGAVYGASTFADLCSIVAPDPYVVMESSWLPYSVCVDSGAEFSAVQSTSTIGEVSWVVGKPEVRGFIDKEQKHRMVVRSQKSGLFGLMETARPSYGDFYEVPPVFYADLWLEGVGQHCNVVEKIPKLQGLVLLENKAKSKLKEPRCRFTGMGQVYEVQSSWDIVNMVGVMGSMSVHQMVDSTVSCGEKLPVFKGVMELRPVTVGSFVSVASSFQGSVVSSKALKFELTGVISNFRGTAKAGVSMKGRVIEGSSKLSGTFSCGAQMVWEFEGSAPRVDIGMKPSVSMKGVMSGITSVFHGGMKSGSSLKSRVNGAVPSFSAKIKSGSSMKGEFTETSVNFDCSAKSVASMKWRLTEVNSSFIGSGKSSVSMKGRVVEDLSVFSGGASFSVSMSGEFTESDPKLRGHVGAGQLMSWGITESAPPSYRARMVKGYAPVEIAFIEQSISAATGDMHKGTLLTSSIKEPPPIMRGIQVKGFNATMALVSSSNEVVGTFINGRRLSMSVVGSFSYSGVLKNDVAHLGPLDVVAPGATFHSRMCAGVLWEALLHDINSSVGGVGREYIGFR